jgi:hypothetical protein
MTTSPLPSNSLLKRLPKSGEVWPEGQRKLWLELLAGSFKLIYQDGLGAHRARPHTEAVGRKA